MKPLSVSGRGEVCSLCDPGSELRKGGSWRSGANVYQVPGRWDGEKKHEVQLLIQYFEVRRKREFPKFDLTAVVYFS